jgi:hypothetical protein
MVNFEREVIALLNEKQTCFKRSRQAYHIRSKYCVTSLAGVTKVITKKDSCIMATKDNVITILRDIHLSTGHKGDKKMYKNISEHFGNIPRHCSLFIKHRHNALHFHFLLCIIRPLHMFRFMQKPSSGGSKLATFYIQCHFCSYSCAVS